jgi:hypothetical protein
MKLFSIAATLAVASAAIAPNSRHFVKKNAVLADSYESMADVNRPRAWSKLPLPVAPVQTISSVLKPTGAGLTHMSAHPHNKHCHGSYIIQISGCNPTRVNGKWILNHAVNPACYWDEVKQTGNPFLRGNPNYSDAKGCPAAYGTKSAFTCDRSINFINRQRYSQISLTDGCRASRCDRNPKYGNGGKTNQKMAEDFCKKTCLKRNGCTGFFFQKHRNGHEICGFYSSKVNKAMSAHHGHKYGAVCTKN